VTSPLFSDQLLAWFDLHGRKHLPWQQQPSPYHVWLSEIMLQQTQVSTVIPYYQRFTAQFNDIKSLAAAPVDDVLALWTGLGYYARGRNLHKAAVMICNDFDGHMPTNIDDLIALPGIGRSTAGAIMALAHQQKFAILDGNVKRVLTRYFAIDGWPGKKSVENTLWELAGSILPEQRIANYIQAQMDLGATVCTRSKPLCQQCPLSNQCQAYQQAKPTNYPTPKPKKAVPTRQVHWLIAQSNNDKILLHQRPAHGIWGGLWSFPECEAKDELCKITADLQLEQLNSSSLDEINHTFSHFKLVISPHLIQCKQQTSYIAENKNLSWYKISDALKLGLPAPVKKVIQSIQ